MNRRKRKMGKEERQEGARIYESSTPGTGKGRTKHDRKEKKRKKGITAEKSWKDRQKQLVDMNRE